MDLLLRIRALTSCWRVSRAERRQFQSKHFKVDLQYDDGRKLQPQLSESFFSTPDNKALIQATEWDRQPIRLMVDGTELHGQVTTDKIIDVMDRHRQ